MLRRLYDRVLALSASPYAPYWLAIVSFAESSFFPIPPDPLLLLMGLAKPNRALRYALICTVASVVGGMLGYFIGFALYEQIALPLIRTYRYEEAAEKYRILFQEWGFWIIMIKGLLPIPYKVVTIISGAASYNFPLFIVASIITRGARFFIIALLLRRYGVSIRDFIERRLTLVTTVAGVAVIAGFLLIRLL